MYEERVYRKLMQSNGLSNFTVIEDESDLHISAESNLEQEASLTLSRVRCQITKYMKKHTAFRHSLVPIEIGPTAPPIVRKMADASSIADVGPMASVAGAVAEAVGNSLLAYSSEVIVENGGDLFIKSKDTKKVLIHAGDSPFSEKVALLIEPSDSPVGICTSSGKIGHSFSFGKADAVVAISHDICLADAAATAVANRVRSQDDIEDALSWGNALPGISGLLIIMESKMGTCGNITLTNP